MTHIDPTSIIRNTSFGENPIVWNFCTILDSKIGNNVHIGAGVEINMATLHNNVHVGSGAFICEGIEIEDNCFIGPRACFTNDKNPIVAEEHYQDFRAEKTIVKKGARIGANATILPGIVIGEYALIGAGAVVTKDVPAYEVWVGCPAKRMKT